MDRVALQGLVAQENPTCIARPEPVRRSLLQKVERVIAKGVLLEVQVLDAVVGSTTRVISQAILQVAGPDRPRSRRLGHIIARIAQSTAAVSRELQNRYNRI